MVRWLLILLVLLVPAGAQETRELHHRLVLEYLPDTSQEEALWPVARDSGLLEKGDPVALRRLYLGAYYSTPAGRARAGAPLESPAVVSAPAPPPLPRVLALQGDEVVRVDGPIDFAIVGSGPAGCVAARVLSLRGYRVVVLEAGSMPVPGSLDARRVPAFKEAHFTSNGSVYVQRGRGVGGGATVNVDLAFAPTLPRVQKRFDKWGLKLPLSEGYAWVVSQLGTRTLSLQEMNENNAVLYRGAEALGLKPSLYALNTWPPGLSPDPVTDKRSPVECLLLPALRSGVGLLSDTEVTRVVDGQLELTTQTPWPYAWKDPAGLGLPAGGRYRLKARKVVLCAGALGTAVLLQRSGIAAGSGVVLHPSMPLIGIYPGLIENWKGTPASVYVENDQFTLLEAMSGGPEYVANLIPGRVHELMREYPRMAGFGVMLVDEVSDSNRVLADGTVEYSLSSEDRRRLARGVAQAVRIHFRAGATKVILPTTEVPWLLESEEQARMVEERLQFVPGKTLLSSAHIQATCKIGLVVDAHGQVLDHPDLYVLDASIFPASVGVNPMQTIYTVAYLLARELKP